MRSESIYRGVGIYLTMTSRIQKALKWYDIAADKYEQALKDWEQLKLTHSKTENDITRRAKDKIRRYEEKLARMSAILANITAATKTVQEQDDDD